MLPLLQIRLRLKRSFLLYKTYFIMSRFTDSSNEYLVSRTTDLCYEGFQSSGNSFFNALLNHLHPNANIAHHTHSLANIQRAVQLGIPVVVPLRDPIDAVASRIARFGERSELDRCLLEYTNFYSYVLRHSEDLIIIPFETIVGDTRQAIETINARTDLHFSLTDLDRKIDEVHVYMRVWSNAHGNPDTIPLPKEERNVEKEGLREAIVRSRYSRSAVEIYHSLSLKPGVWE